MNRPRGLLPSSSSRSAKPSNASRAKASPSCWSNRTSGSLQRSLIAIILSNTAKLSTVSRTLNCKPIWTSFTPISVSENNGNIQRGTAMKTRIFAALLIGTALNLSAASLAYAQDKTVKIGVLTDNSGLYSDLGGAGSTLAAQMAVEDSGLAAKGWKIDVISADHQNKPDIATSIARQWIDVEKVDIFMDVLNSGVALAVNNVVKEKNSIMINTGAATSDLTNAQCSPNTVHW